ncbi:hypothetical protein PCE1_004270 [Barthelona sp. PCE]
MPKQPVNDAENMDATDQECISSFLSPGSKFESLKDAAKYWSYFMDFRETYNNNVAPHVRVGSLVWVGYIKEILTSKYANKIKEYEKEFSAPYLADYSAPTYVEWLKISRSVHLSSHIYNTDDHHCPLTLLKVGANDRFQPKFWFGKLSDTTYYLTIRGTFSLGDVLSDAACDLMTFPVTTPSHGEVHCVAPLGFARSVLYLLDILGEEIYNIQSNGYHLTITGHSLGGAVSGLMGCVLYARGFPKELLDVHSYAPAPYLSISAHQIFRDVSFGVRHFVNRRDAVCSLSRASLVCFLKNLSSSGHFKSYDLFADFAQMDVFIPGAIIHIEAVVNDNFINRLYLNVDNTVFSMTIRESGYFSNFSNELFRFTDHLYTSYDKYIQKYVKQLSQSIVGVPEFTGPVFIKEASAPTLQLNDGS